MQIETCHILSPAEPEWRAFVESCPHATVFHHPQWINLLSACYGYRSFVIAVKDELGHLCAGLPVLEIRSLITGRRWDSLPYSDYCTPLYLDSTALGQLTASLITLAKQNKVPCLIVRGDLPDYPEVRRQTDYVMHELPLCETPDETMRCFGHSHRQNIRTASKRGVSVQWGQHIDDMRTFYTLQLQTRHRHGVPMQPWRYFKMLYETMIETKLGFVLLANKDEECLAGGVFLHWNQHLIAKYAASREDSLGLRPNEQIFWTAMSWGCQNGYRTFDFGRTEIANEGLRQFKCRWGAAETPLSYSVVGSPSLSTDGRLRQAMEKFIRHSPPWVCRITGELLYGHFG
jgi:lipid II:glycine glycyltransferase (peptidoglycan interpeptide bridge formation enzyme)